MLHVNLTHKLQSAWRNNVLFNCWPWQHAHKSVRTYDNDSVRPPNLICDAGNKREFEAKFYNWNLKSCPVCDRYPDCNHVFYWYSHTKEMILNSRDWCRE